MCFIAPQLPDICIGIVHTRVVTYKLDSGSHFLKLLHDTKCCN